MRYLFLALLLTKFVHSQKNQIPLVDVTDVVWDTLQQENKNYYWAEANRYVMKFGLSSQYNKLSNFENDKSTIPHKAKIKKCLTNELCYYTDNSKWKLSVSSSKRIGGKDFQIRIYEMKFNNGDVVIHTITIENGKIIDKVTAKSF